MGKKWGYFSVSSFATERHTLFQRWMEIISQSLMKAIYFREPVLGCTNFIS